MALIGKDIAMASAILEGGGLVGIPTETVYGLAANALDPEATTKIFKVKNRPEFDPLIVHTSHLERVKEYVERIPEKAFALAELFWPGPLTILLEKKPIIPDLVTSGLDRVAIRIPSHPLTLQLLERIPFPLAAPSANPFGYISPTEASHVNDQLGDKIDYILDGGSCCVGLESTIVGFEEGMPMIYRLGGMSLEQIEAAIGRVDLKPHSTSNPSAPGMLMAHYSPKKPLLIGKIEELVAENKGKKVAVLCFGQNYVPEKGLMVYNLSAVGNIDEAAQNLFMALRRLDNAPIDMILTELVPDKGLGRAINDRLKRAAVKI